MKTPRLKRNLALLFSVVLAQLPATASACSVCMGDPNSKTAGAANGAIFLMLGFIGAMLAGVGAFAFNLMRRAGAPVPPHVAVAEEISAADQIQ